MVAFQFKDVLILARAIDFLNTLCIKAETDREREKIERESEREREGRDGGGGSESGSRISSSELSIDNREFELLVTIES